MSIVIQWKKTSRFKSMLFDKNIFLFDFTAFSFTLPRKQYYQSNKIRLIKFKSKKIVFFYSGKGPAQWYLLQDYSVVGGASMDFLIFDVCIFIISGEKNRARPTDIATKSHCGNVAYSIHRNMIQLDPRLGWYYLYIVYKRFATT